MPSNRLSALQPRAVLTALCLSFLLGATTALADRRCDPAGAAITSTERFAPQGDGTVVDTASKLEWKRCSEGQAWLDGTCVGEANTYNWHQALEHAETVSSAGHSDWRLPELTELMSIVEPTCVEPAIDLQVFPATPPFAYWSATPFEYFIRLAWAVYFNSGSDGYSPKDYGYFHIRLVRDPP